MNYESSWGRGAVRLRLALALVLAMGALYPPQALAQVPARFYTSAHKFRDMYLEGFSSVIPAKAGIHASLKPTPSHPWMPAFAGMTGMRHVRSAIEATRSCPVTYARLYIGRPCRAQMRCRSSSSQ